MSIRHALLFVFLSLALITTANAADDLLRDVNGDGNVVISAMGDSICRGTGDFISPDDFVTDVTNPSTKAGYPLRIETFLNLPVNNLGVPGERVTNTMVARFAQQVRATNPDVLVFNGGTNDAIDKVSPGAFRHAVQSIVNIAHASGITPVILSIPPPCCDNIGHAPFIDAYNEQLAEIAIINNVRFADVHTAFLNFCGSHDCSLLNRPEGLHPNISGYDVMGEMSTAALLGIDLLSSGGAGDFASAVGVSKESVLTVPSASP